MLAPRVLREPRTVARRLLRRHRRSLAALTAGLAMLVALSALRATPSPATAAPATQGVRSLAAGEVIVPVLLSSPAVASVLAKGDIVDVVGFAGDEPAVIAPRVRIVDLPSVGSSFTTSSAVVLLVAAPESQALALSAASADGGVAILLRGR